MAFFVTYMPKTIANSGPERPKLAIDVCDYPSIADLWSR